MSEDVSNGVCRSLSGANWSAYSLQGRTRERNSDAFTVFERDGTQVFALADGVGSMPGSPIASSTAVDAMVGAAELGLLDHPLLITETMDLVNEAVGYSLGESGLNGATTLAFAVLEAARPVAVFSVGDSEVHAISGAGDSRLLHELDHVPARPNVLLAWIDGQSSFEAHKATAPADATHLCLMSDGVPAALGTSDIARIIRTKPIADGARELVLAARRAGANDDLTAIVVALASREEALPATVLK